MAVEIKSPKFVTDGGNNGVNLRIKADVAIKGIVFISLMMVSLLMRARGIVQLRVGLDHILSILT